MKIEKYNDIMIAFDTDNETVNATDVIKAFPGKRMNNFLRQKQTKDFINALEADAPIGVSALTVKKGGVNQGTWMHRLLAYKFAAFCSPHFEVFVYKVFDEAVREKLKTQQAQLDYFWDKEDQKDLYK